LIFIIELFILSYLSYINWIIKCRCELSSGDKDIILIFHLVAIILIG